MKSGRDNLIARGRPTPGKNAGKLHEMREGGITFEETPRVFGGKKNINRRRNEQGEVSNLLRGKSEGKGRSQGWKKPPLQKDDSKCEAREAVSFFQEETRGEPWKTDFAAAQAGEGSY